MYMELQLQRKVGKGEEEQEKVERKIIVGE